MNEHLRRGDVSEACHSCSNEPSARDSRKPDTTSAATTASDDLFAFSPISMWEEDLSDVKKRIDELKALGVTDFRTYFREHPDEAESCTRESRIVDVNDATLELFEARSKEELVASIDWILGDTPPVLGRLTPNILCIAAEERQCAGEIQARSLTGRPLSLRYMWSVPQARANDYSRVCFSVLNVTDRQEAEARLRESEERFRSVVESLPMGLQAYIVSDDGHLTLAESNPIADRILGIDGGACIGQPMAAAMPALKETEIPEKCRQVGLTGVPWRVAEIEYDCGEARRTLECHAFQTAPGSMAVLLVDHTERKRAELEQAKLQERIRQGQKMAAIGELAGGVAHDFNNLLTAIQGSAELLKISLPADSDQERLAGQVFDASRRATQLTTQLLAFSRVGPSQFVTVDLHNVIKEAVQFLRRSIDPLVEVSMDLRAEDSKLMGDPALLQTAFLNLGLNARDAMPRGGRLVFATRSMTENPDATEHTVAASAAGWIEARVVDTGIGIPREIRDRVYEPFFTTKNHGKGTGLGLATVYGCVQAHGGTVDIESTSGQGTTFTMLFPVTASRDEPVPLISPSTLVRGRGTVLVVDDEEFVLRFSRAALEKLGYTVVTQVDSTDAIAYYAGHQEGIDLVILDLIMPRMSGRDVFRELKRINPEVRVLIASAFSQEATADQLIHEGVAGFLSKPYTIDRLSQEVARHTTRSEG